MKLPEQAEHLGSIVEESGGASSARGTIACVERAQGAGKRGRGVPAVPDTLLEAGAGPTLLTPAASHAQKPPEGTDWCRVGFGC